MSSSIKQIHDKLRNPPEVLSIQELPDATVAKSGMIRIEQLHLRFTNGVERHYQRMKRGRGAVMMVPLLDRETALLIREYAAGTDRYELVLPKGRLEKGEDILEAANRELMEEVGYGARQLREINRFTLAPTFMGHETHVILATDLYEQREQGDEPEELEVIPWKLSELNALIAREDCTEARSMAALYMVREMLAQGEIDV